MKATEEDIGPRAQRIVASSVALDVLRSSSVLETCCRSAGIDATIEVSACLHTNGIRSNAIALHGMIDDLDRLAIIVSKYI